MRKYILPCLVLGLLIGVSVLLYPAISKYVNAQNQTRTVAKYFDEVAGMDDAETRAILQAAREYNEKLLGQTTRFRFTKAEETEYLKQLDAGNGIMGILEINKIKVKLPIYHGTEDGVLQIGIGHMQGTSLPVGGIGTHAFITGHRGVPSSKLLSDLDEMAVGDLFELYILGETLTYRVDDIKTVLPFQVRSLDIDRGMDYCTLVTCTPYGVNSHRLLVRGHRVENREARGWQALHAEAKMVDRIIAIRQLRRPGRRQPMEPYLGGPGPGRPLDGGRIRRRFRLHKIHRGQRNRRLRDHEHPRSRRAGKDHPRRQQDLGTRKQSGRQAAQVHRAAHQRERQVHPAKARHRGRPLELEHKA